MLQKTFTKVDKEKEIILSNKLGQNNLKNNHLFVSHNIKNNKYDNNIYSTFSVNQIKSDGQEIYDDIYSFFDHNTVSLSSRLYAGDKLSMAIRTTYDKKVF